MFWQYQTQSRCMTRIIRQFGSLRRSVILSPDAGHDSIRSSKFPTPASRSCGSARAGQILLAETAERVVVMMMMWREEAGFRCASGGSHDDCLGAIHGAHGWAPPRRRPPAHRKRRWRDGYGFLPVRESEGKGRAGPAALRFCLRLLALPVLYCPIAFISAQRCGRDHPPAFLTTAEPYLYLCPSPARSAGEVLVTQLRCKSRLPE